MSCHQKLDPVGHVFDTSAVSLAKTPSKGALVMVRSKNEKEVIPVSGFAELGRAIVKQPEYKRCQVERFWNWFIGQNIPISTKRKSEIVTRRLIRQPSHR